MSQQSGTHASPNANKIKARNKSYSLGLLLLTLAGFIFAYLSKIEILMIGMVVFFFFGLISMNVADAAESKGRHWEDFFYLSILISPLVTGLIVASIREDAISQNPSVNTFQTKLGVADEVKKLSELRDAGILTEVEFMEQKKKIL